jgi:glycosyltransferase involved in cell wall biosynthesis
MRLAVYTDYVYRRVDGVVYAERAFALFLAALTPHVERLRLVGRLAPDGGQTRYALPGDVELAGLPHYDSLARPAQALRSLLGSIRPMWSALAEIDVVWILGPFPHAVLLTLVALARRTPVVIGVRQDWPSYVRMRRPGRRWMHGSADLLEWIWRSLARRLPVVAVGSELSAKYAHAPAVLDLVVSMVPAAEVERPVRARDYGSERQILSVGRLDQEKNPLLLADVLALLESEERRWRLRVCGEGDLADALADRLAALGLQERADLLGYVPMGDELFELYRSSHVLLHVSWTEGFPQVLAEAFACGLPVVATDVGGVRAGAGQAALLVPPGDPRAAADAVLRLACDSDLRARLTEAGRQRAHDLTLEAQTARLAAFLHQAARPGRSGWLPIRHLRRHGDAPAIARRRVP